MDVATGSCTCCGFTPVSASLVLAEDKCDQTRNSFCEPCVYLLHEIQMHVDQGTNSPGLSMPVGYQPAVGISEAPLSERVMEGGDVCPRGEGCTLIGPVRCSVQPYQPPGRPDYSSSVKTEVYVTQRDQNMCNQ